jgi:hypothetical protein
MPTYMSELGIEKAEQHEFKISSCVALQSSRELLFRLNGLHPPLKQERANEMSKSIKIITTSIFCIFASHHLFISSSSQSVLERSIFLPFTDSTSASIPSPSTRFHQFLTTITGSAIMIPIKPLCGVGLQIIVTASSLAQALPNQPSIGVPSAIPSARDADQPVTRHWANSTVSSASVDALLNAANDAFWNLNNPSGMAFGPVNHPSAAARGAFGATSTLQSSTLDLEDIARIQASIVNGHTETAMQGFLRLHGREAETLDYHYA